MTKLRHFMESFDGLAGSTTHLSDHEVVEHIEHDLRSGRLVAVQKGEGARHSAGEVAEQRNLATRVERETGGKLIYQGRQYKLVAGVDYQQVPGRDGYAVVSHKEACLVLDGMSKEEPAAAESLGQARAKLTRDWHAPAGPDGMVLLRRLPVAPAGAKRGDEGDPITPAQMKQMMENGTPSADKPKPTFVIAEFVQVFQYKGSETLMSPVGGRQYINLDENTDSTKAHPEYGRVVQFKVRVQCLEGSASPAGQAVYLTSIPGGKNRAGLAAADREGLGSAGGSATTSATTDANGWTPAIRFYLSTYGGDEFVIAASLAPASTSSDLRSGTYVVWRRIFYDVLEMKRQDGKGKYELSPAIEAKVKAGFEDVFLELHDLGNRALGDYHDNFDEVEKAFKWADGYCTSGGVPLKLHICVVDRVVPWAGPYGAKQRSREEDADAVVFTSTARIPAYDYSGHTWLVRKEYLDGTTWKALPAQVSLDGTRGDRKFIVDFRGTSLAPSPTTKIKVRITYMLAGSYGGWGGANSLHLVLCRGTYEDMMSKSDADKQIAVASLHEPGHAMGLVSSGAVWHDNAHSAHCKYAGCTMWYESSPGNERFHGESTSDPGCRTFLRQKVLDKNAMQSSWKFPR